jgi:hypothetical protein
VRTSSEQPAIRIAASTEMNERVKVPTVDGIRKTPSLQQR